jgi:tetratricopeptide (TPR) repeat protein
VTRGFLLACLLSASVAAGGLAAQGRERPGQQPGSRSSQAPQSKTESNVPEEEDESVAPRKYTLDPLESDRNIKVGNFYWSKRDYRAALSRYEEATRYNPSSPEAFFKVGEAQEKLKHPDAAKTAFQKVIQIAPETKLAQEAKKKLSRKG